jgi:hypothetical protein
MRAFSAVYGRKLLMCVFAIVMAFAGGVVFAPQPAFAGTGFNGGDITVTPSTGLDPMGDLVHVHLTGFTPGDLIDTRECVTPPTGAGDECDTLIGNISDHAVLGDGTFDEDIAAYDCDTANSSCYIAAFESSLQVAAYQQVFFDSGGGTVPDAPTGVKAASGYATKTSGAMKVTYLAPANDGGSAITGFAATCTSGNGGVTKSGTHAGAQAAPITVKGLTTAKSYRCIVKAANNSGTSLASARSVPVLVGSPAAPKVTSVTRVTAGQLKVTFSLGASNGSAITSQIATCASTNGGVAKSGTHSGAKAAPIAVKGLTSGKSYRCTVAAKNARGKGLPSAKSSSVTA